METISVMGHSTSDDTATEVTLDNVPPIDEIVAGEICRGASGVNVRIALTVVSDTPDADKEIQLTATNKFKLYIAAGTAALATTDTLILQVRKVGEVTRP